MSKLDFIYILEKIVRIPNRLKWLIFKNKLAVVGKNSHVEKGFSIVGAECIAIGENFSAGTRLKLHVFDGEREELEHSKKIRLKIGNDVTITDNCYISCLQGVSVEDGVLFGENVFVCDNYHGSAIVGEEKNPPAKRKLFSKGEVVIGKNVWLGRNVCVMPGVKIGDGAIIGANAVVTHDIGAGKVAVGTPAREISGYKQEIDNCEYRS